MNLPFQTWTRQGQNNQTQAEFLSTVANMLQKCGCADMTFEAWRDFSFVATVASSEAEDRHQMAASIQCFCFSLKSLPGNIERSVGKILGDPCLEVLKACKALAASSLPSLFEELSTHLFRGCLDAQEWFSKNMPSNQVFMYQPDSKDVDFWMRASTFEEPVERLNVLKDVASALDSTTGDGALQDQLKACELAVHKALLMKSLSMYHYVTKRDSLLDKPSREALVTAMPLVQKYICKALSTLKDLESHPMIQTFKTHFTTVIVEQLGGQILSRFADFINEAGVAALNLVFWYLTFLKRICDLKFELFDLNEPWQFD